MTDWEYYHRTQRLPVLPWFLAGLVAVTVLSWALAVASSRSAGKGGPGRSARPGPPQSTT
ncbi:hypothetical protein ACFSKW_05585 [Nonomuraea mangrovi]|uniref:Uncharacterized protein n=1 Tax=Nonomuraea mangrovi TaxID=2316207 RepID=A0ABW4SN78_9ACTN